MAVRADPPPPLGRTPGDGRHRRGGRAVLQGSLARERARGRRLGSAKAACSTLQNSVPNPPKQRAQPEVGCSVARTTCRRLSPPALARDTETIKNSQASRLKGTLGGGKLWTVGGGEADTQTLPHRPPPSSLHTAGDTQQNTFPVFLRTRNTPLTPPVPFPHTDRGLRGPSPYSRRHPT